ncbi:MAG: peptide deformylase [bacterium]|nr:peptide deformylase [bacterium]
MALRNIRTIGDSVLNKRAREVEDVDQHIEILIEDMLDTMYEAQGVGLAAPQIGILKRIVVIDVSPEGDDPIILINPEIIEQDGEQEGSEGCLSVPGKVGIVKRPNHVKVRAFDMDMNEFEIEGTELLARAFCHEIDHLDGHLYVEHLEGQLMDVDQLED